jgi:hypothetical protein
VPQGEEHSRASVDWKAEPVQQILRLLDERCIPDEDTSPAGLAAKIKVFGDSHAGNRRQHADRSL